MGFSDSDRNLSRKNVNLLENDGWTDGEEPDPCRPLLGNQRQLPDGGVVPDGVRQRQDVAAVHLAVALVAGGEVQQGEGVARPLRLRGQSRGANHGHDAVVEDDPVRLLRERGGESVSAEPREFNSASAALGTSPYRESSYHQADGIHPRCDVLPRNQGLAEGGRVNRKIHK